QSGLQIFNAERRCRAGENRRHRDALFQVAEQSLLLGEIFFHSFDNKVDGIETLPSRREVNGGELLSKCLHRDLAALHRLLQMTYDAERRVAERQFAGLLDDDLEAAQDGEMG